MSMRKIGLNEVTRREMLNQTGVCRKNFLLIDDWSGICDRFYNLFRRENKLFRLTAAFKIKANSPKTWPSFEQLKAFIVLNKIDFIVITSEIFLESTQELATRLVQSTVLLRDTHGVKLISYSIKKPLPLLFRSLTDPSTSAMCENEYHRNLNFFNSQFESKVDLLFKLDSYLGVNSSIDDNLMSSHKSAFFDQNVYVENFRDIIEVVLLDDLLNELRVGMLNDNFSPSSFGVKVSVKTLHALMRAGFKGLSTSGGFDDIIATSSDIVENNTTASLRDVVTTSAYQQSCSFELIYRMEPSATFVGESVASIRYQMGESLLESIPIEERAQIDIVVPIPETGKYYAQGLASALGVPYVEGISRNSDIGRSFDIEKPAERKNLISSKLSFITDIIEGKNICLVDEAIFTGSTLSVVCQMLKKIDVGKVFIAIPTPQCITQCVFNMQPKRALLLEYIRAEDLLNYFDVNGVYFKSGEMYISELEERAAFCTSCFLVDEAI